jgi:hypothetical protein
VPTPFNEHPPIPLRRQWLHQPLLSSLLDER